MTHLKSSSRKLVGLVLGRAAPLLVFLLCAETSCDPILTQNPAEHFVDGKMPAGAVRLANEFWELPLERILARVAKDRENPYLLRVGVIDCGVDIGHPDLIDQIDFKTDANGRLISAGFDVMGGDQFGAPQILHLEYYAFGAEGLVDNKIKGPPRDPLAVLKKYDSDFLDRFIPKLQSNPALQGTLFQKFNKQNFSILGAQLYADLKFDADAYAKSLADGELMGPDFVPKDLGTPRRLHGNLSLFYTHIFESYDLGPKGFPVGHGAGLSPTMFEPSSMVNRLKGGKEFLELVKTEYASFAKKSGYEKDFNQFVDFSAPRLFDKSKTREDQVNDAIEKLTNALIFSREGYSTQDPMRKFERALYEQALERALDRQTAWPKGRIIPTPDDLKSASKDAFSFFAEIANYVKTNQDQFEIDEIEAAQEYLDRLNAWTHFYEGYLERRGWDPTKIGDGVTRLSPEEQSIYRKHLVRTQHPLLDSKAITEAHGSHVSGAIARQNKDLRIFPIRVVTESTQKSPVKDAEILSEFRKSFDAWLEDPLVLRAIEGKFSTLLGGQKGPELVSTVRGIFDPLIAKDFEKHSLDYRFLEEVEKAVEVAGAEKLKLVNISLGTGFDRGVVDYRNLDLRKQAESYFQFMKFEYFKWKVGKTADEKAGGTLFLVATGNDGAWKDGISKSALPVDLSSPFLREFEDASKGLVAPNNRIKNILGVGSISQLDEISSYSNILISGAPMVMAHGEAVLSMNRSLSTEATDAAWKELTSIDHAGLEMSSIANSDRLKDFVIKKFGLPAGEDDEAVIAYIQRKARISSEWHEIGEAADHALALDLFLHHPNIRVKMSGTSMATPTLTGLLADEIQKRAVKLGIPTAQLYDHPDFTPEKLIQLVFDKAEPLKKGSQVVMLKKWTGEKIWEKSKEQTEFEKIMDDAKNHEGKFMTAPRASMGPDQCTENFFPTLTTPQR